MENIDEVKESLLEDLDMFIHLNQDDFDRGKGFVLIQKFIDEKRDSSPSESQSVVDNEEAKEDFYCDWKGDGYPERCAYQCEVCRDYEKSD